MSPMLSIPTGPEFTDHSVSIEPGRGLWPFEVHVGYTWRGKTTVQVSYFKSRSGATRRRNSIRGFLGLDA